MKIQCFEVVDMVVSEATKQFRPLWDLDRAAYKVLAQYCEAIDSILEEFDGEAIDVLVDDIKMTISITLTFSEMIIEDKNHLVCRLAKRCERLGFCTSEEEDMIDLAFVFPSLWIKI